jgi:GNAT superfamily N-acetyltransferase
MVCGMDPQGRGRLGSMSPGDPQAPAIRRASPQDRSAVTATVAAAFAEDPAWAFIFGEQYQRLVHSFVAVLFDLRVRSHNVWVSDELAAVAMWDAPIESERPSGHARGLWAGYRAIAGDEAFERLTVYNEAVAAHSPAEPHWYLGILATHPERRREGLATAVLAPVLDEADKAGVACCLETSTTENRRFYERRGFAVTADIVLPGGPPTWYLYRAPMARGKP